MSNDLKIKMDESVRKKSDLFMRNIKSDMHYNSRLNNDDLNFDWLVEIEAACPYLENLIRNPKLFLQKEDEVVKIEKAKKISVESVKNLSRNTQYIDKIDKLTNEIQPSKIMISKREETYNIYENRFVYTLIDNLEKFISKKEEELKDLQIRSNKVLEYAGVTTTGEERITIELKIKSFDFSKDNKSDAFYKELQEISERLEKVSSYIAGWKRSGFTKAMQKSRATYVSGEVRKTNAILKNPNLQIAMKLWIELKAYQEKQNAKIKNILDTDGNDILKGILNDTFLMNYFILDSISKTRKLEKQKLTSYAVVMINQQIKRTVELLLSGGVKVDDDAMLKLIADEMKADRSQRLVGEEDVKKKFKSAMDEYLERTKKYL